MEKGRSIQDTSTLQVIMGLNLLSLYKEGIYLLPTFSPPPSTHHMFHKGRWVSNGYFFQLTHLLLEYQTRIKQVSLKAKSLHAKRVMAGY